MEPINVLVNDQIVEETVPRLEAVDPRLNVTHVGALLTAELEGDDEARRLLDQMLSNADAYAGMRIPPRLLDRAPKLKWLQVTQAGVDKILLDERFRRSPVVLSNVSDIHSFAPAEFAIQACLTFTKNPIECHRQKLAREWKPFHPGVLRGRTMGLVGYGNIGTRIARVAKAFDMWVIAARRSARKASRSRWADLVVPVSQLDRVLSESDFVVVSLPLTSDTFHRISNHEFETMKRGAFFVNVGRGPVVDEKALAEALKRGLIAGAALDVFEVEPLPQESPLWDIPNLLYSPHIAGYIEAYARMVQDLFVQNLERYVRGDKPIGLVNKKRGY
jgi:phosphoglycerate dehydrogenase-like enzyme